MLLGLATYGVGLPDLAARPQHDRGRGDGATAVAALVMSFCQLVVGSALLPRFTVFGSAAVLVPWSLLVSIVDRDAGERAEDRDRVVFVGSRSDAEMFTDDLRCRPERPAALVATLAPGDARPHRAGEEPLVDAVIARDATVLVLAVDAQDDPLVVAQASTLHEAGVRVRTLTMFYDEWLGKLPLSELERLSLMFDIAEVHHARYGRVKRLFDIVLGARRRGRARGRDAVRDGRQPLRQPRARCSTGSDASAGTAASSRSSSSARCCPHDGTLPDEWTARGRSARSRRSVVGCGARMSTSCRRSLNILRGELDRRRAAAGAAALRRKSSPRSCRTTACGTSCARASPVGRR